MRLPADLLSAAAGPGPCASCGGAVDGAWRLCAACRERLEATRLDALRAADEAAHRAREAAALEEALATIPADFRGLTLDHVRVRRVAPPAALAAVRSLASGAPCSVLLEGAGGAGKTHLAVALLNAWMRPWAMFGMAFEFAQARAERGYGRGATADVERGKYASVLVLDDLGAETVVNGALTEIIYERTHAGRPTIITTGLTLQQLIERYGDGLARRIVERWTVIAVRRAAHLNLKGV